MTNPHIAIDLTRNHFVRHLGDVSVYGTWLFNHDQEAEEPALVLIPRYRARGFKPCVVALSAAYKYNNPRYAVAAAGEFAINLGFEFSPFKVCSLADIIHSHLGDLVSMPPSPTTAIIVGEANIDIGGKRHSIQMVDYEPTPQA